MFPAVGGGGCISADSVWAPESCSAWIHSPGGEFAMGEPLIFTSILWSVSLPSSFVSAKMKDGKLVLDFGVLIFIRSNIDLHEKDKNCVGIRSCPPWLGAQKIRTLINPNYNIL